MDFQDPGPHESLADMEKRIMPIMSPRHEQTDFVRNISSFRRGATSIDLLAKPRGQVSLKTKRKLISGWGIAFLVLALLQVVVVAGIQIAIAVLGRFNGGQLEEYVPCVLKEYNATNRTLPSNSTYPSFGKDKAIYVYIFIFVGVYNFGLCLYALITQRIVEVWSFVAINFGLIMYAAVQVYQFRGFSNFCDSITLVGWLALANVLAILLFNIVFCLIAIQMHVEFGWKLYKFVNCNPALRFYYRNYEIFLSIVKALIVFTIAFLVGQVSLILPLNNYEFWLSYPFILGMILLYFYSFFMVRRESHIACSILLFIGLLLLAYYAFKVFRYTTQSCPVCEDLADQLNDRREDFQHLVMMASLNLLVTLGYIISVIRVWTQFGKGLSDHFYIHGYWFDRILRKPPQEEAYLSSVGTGEIMKKKTSALLLRVRNFGSEDSDTLNVQRNSSLDETDYTKDLVFTPSTEIRPQFSINNGSTQEHTEINRTFSLPPILEEKNIKN